MGAPPSEAAGAQRPEHHQQRTDGVEEDRRESDHVGDRAV
jgi:hypothetical protein